MGERLDQLGTIMGESDGGLLPRHAKDFGDRDYWDAFFRRRGRKAFEWYGEYAQLCSLLRKYARPSDKLLVVGCGNSALSQEMHDVGGYRELVSIDLSEVAIRQMKSKRPDLDFRVVDATDMTAEFADGAFSCVLDKGTLDAMFTGEEENVVKTVDKMFEVGPSWTVEMTGSVPTVVNTFLSIGNMSSSPVGWPLSVH